MCPESGVNDKKMNPSLRNTYVHLAVPEYSLWMIADTFPKILAYIRAEIEDGEYGGVTREEKAPFHFLILLSTMLDAKI